MVKVLGKIAEKVVNTLICIIIVAILFCLYNLFSLKVLKNDYTNFFGYTIFEVATGSMGDALTISDAVIVKLDSSYKVNDIITYKSGKDFITHRVLEVNDDYLITKGDANNTQDNPVEKSQVLGRVVCILDNVGVWKDVLLTPKVVILIFVTLFIFSLLFSYNGQKIQISMVSDEGTFKLNDRVQVRKGRKKIKTLEATQVMVPINLDKVEKIVPVETPLINLDKVEPININNTKVNKKKSIEYTQIINLDEINKEKKKKNLEYTQVIELPKEKKKKKNLEFTQVINLKGDHND